jgi:hypothetical protein
MALTGSGTSSWRKCSGADGDPDLEVGLDGAQSHGIRLGAEHRTEHERRDCAVREGTLAALREKRGIRLAPLFA